MQSCWPEAIVFQGDGSLVCLLCSLADRGSTLQPGPLSLRPPQPALWFCSHENGMYNLYEAINQPCRFRGFWVMVRPLQFPSRNSQGGFTLKAFSALSWVGRAGQLAALRRRASRRRSGEVGIPALQPVGLRDARHLFYGWRNKGPK